jgi:hypothetical protein
VFNCENGIFLFIELSPLEDADGNTLLYDSRYGRDCHGVAIPVGDDKNQTVHRHLVHVISIGARKQQ